MRSSKPSRPAACAAWAAPGFPPASSGSWCGRRRATPKYVICNADESEPGTFKDRVILQTLPDLVLEGMALAALAVGARKAIIYIRHEYARQRDVLLKTLRQRQAEGVLGSYMMGSSHHVEFEIFESPGGYICGEETALLEALEDGGPSRATSRRFRAPAGCSAPQRC